MDIQINQSSMYPGTTIDIALEPEELITVRVKLPDEDTYAMVGVFEPDGCSIESNLSESAVTVDHNVVHIVGPQCASCLEIELDELRKVMRY